MPDISNNDDTIDSRDVITRIDELESERSDLESNIEDAETEFHSVTSAFQDWEDNNCVEFDSLSCRTDLDEDESARRDELESEQSDLQVEVTDAERNLETANSKLEEWDDGSDGSELKALKKLQEEAEGYSSDWHHGATLIHENYFEEYCKKLCEYAEYLPRNLPDYIVIDWEATAENLKVDYTEVTYDGQTYLIRNN